MNRILFLTLFSLISACKKETTDRTIPACIRSKVIDDSLTKVKTIRVQKIGNELHYWLNTDYGHFDGIEYVVNNSCDTLCRISGEQLPSPNACYSNYYFEKWEIIWQK